MLQLTYELRPISGTTTTRTTTTTRHKMPFLGRTLCRGPTKIWTRCSKKMKMSMRSLQRGHKDSVKKVMILTDLMAFLSKRL